MSVVKTFLFSCALFALFIVVTWNDDRMAIERKSSSPTTPSRTLARQYYDFAHQSLPDCYQRLRGPGSEIAKAIIAVENASIGRMELFLERYAFPFFSHILGGPINWSVGPGQLRASTLIEAGIGFSDTEPAMLNTLTDNCRNIHASHQLVSVLSERNKEVHGSVSAGRVAMIREYNGQLESSLPNDLYVAVVLTVFDHIRASHRHDLVSRTSGNSGDSILNSF